MATSVDWCLENCWLNLRKMGGTRLSHLAELEFQHWKVLAYRLEYVWQQKCMHARSFGRSWHDMCRHEHRLGNCWQRLCKMKRLSWNDKSNSNSMGGNLWLKWMCRMVLKMDSASTKRGVTV